jgi:hypothetical protein
MTVRQLLKHLQSLPAEALDRKVVIDKSNGEGSPLSSIHDACYQAEQTWYGYLIHPDDAADYSNAEKVILLSPIN